MSLIGNLEDLSLPDILQIISLSKKSGVLTIHRGEEDGKIYLRHGKVILTASARSKRNIGDLLMERGIITRTQLEGAVAHQKREGMKELLGRVLLRLGIIDHEILERIVQEQIEESVFYFLTWKEGTFKFDLGEVDERLEVGIDPQVLMSQRGIDTQWLVLEGTRLLDERRRAVSTRSPEEAPAAAAEGARLGEGIVLVLVDDDDVFSAQFQQAAEKRKLAVQRLAGVTEAREYLASSLGGEDLVMVVDVVMPTADGRGFLGGVELARMLRSDSPEIRLRVITAYPDDSVQEELRKIGVGPYLLKPEPGDGDRALAAMESFLEQLLESVQRKERPAAGAAPVSVPPPQAAGPAPSSTVTPRPAAAAPGPPLVRPPAATGAAPAPPVDTTEEEIVAGIKALEGILNRYPSFRLMVGDLIHESQMVRTGGEVGLIILRLASELLERSILFRVIGERVASLGGFGFEAEVIKNRDGLRNLTINMTNSPVLRMVAGRREPLSSVEHRLADDDLLALVIGQPLPASWILVPAEGAEGTKLILYGDTGQSGREVQGAEILQSFMKLAGLVLKKMARRAETGIAVSGPAFGE